MDIDSIRFAISKVSDENKKYFYLTLLMNSMCKAQSTTGHFAQYMNKDHERIIPLRNISVLEMFYDKRNDFNEFATSIYDNINFNWDYKKKYIWQHIQQMKKGLKVLDMIQKNINELNYKEPSWKNNYVFQMPQDAEVKE